MWTRLTDWLSAYHRGTVIFWALFFIIWAIIDPSLHTIHVLYSAMWSNMWAPSIWTLGGIVVADVRNARRHRVQKDHHTNVVSELAGQIEELSDRLRSLLPGGDNDTK